MLHDYVDAIDAAAKDSHITGLACASRRWKPAGASSRKFAATCSPSQKRQAQHCYLGSTESATPNIIRLRLQQIWLVPTAPVSIRGMMAQALFFRGTLDKLKIVPEFYHIAEYKTAGNIFTEKQFTPAHKEEVEGLLHSIYEQYLDGASKAREMDRAQFEALLNRGPFSSSDAVTNKIVDRLGYWDQLQGY